MRGRLIQRMKVSIARLNESATQAVTGGGYDADFNEPLPVSDGTQLGATSKRYYDPVVFTCQLDRETWGRTKQSRDGQEKVADIVIVLHRAELEKMGYIGTNGEPKFRRGDKIIEIRNVKGGIEQTFNDPPGMFIHDMDTAGHGLEAFGTPRQNLLYLYCNYDMKGGQK